VLPLLKKPTREEDGCFCVTEFAKDGIWGSLRGVFKKDRDFGGELLGEMSQSQTVEFRASQIANEASKETELKDLAILFEASDNRRTQYPLAPTSIANKSAIQPFSPILSTKAPYLFLLMECHSLIFSSQGLVSSIMIACFDALEKMTMSGRRLVAAIK